MTERKNGSAICVKLGADNTGSQPVEARKNVSQLFGSGKNWFLAISSLTNTVAAIWREKKVEKCDHLFKV